ncbi:hypothetical protein CYMTET_24668 [Cymbomonas tetramitiformis]|uniref:Septin-type G domain-containing protein n=1 Tax=Cymbomonas tetramitiformis TaxID=36881 RepID=A0AAE0KZR2_9CHLO|nr:hypothetical protein CYMTET_24668 [Cymbomonas tetramitiformis]
MASRRGLKTKARLTDEEYGNFPPEKTSWSHDEQSMLYFKICVVGGAGVGKSTLIQVLTNAVGTVPQVTRSFDDSHKFALTFTNNIRPRTVVCTLVDSPAVHGDSTDLQGDIDRVTAYIKDCVKPKERPSNLDFSAHQFLIPVSDGDSCNRVDCCLYILPPHRLTAADSEALLQLSELVAIIPVISRADALSPVEKALLRTHVLEDLRQVGLPPVEPSLQMPGMPLAGICCEVPLIVGCGHTLEGGAPVRRYPWGTFRPELDEHSDLALLRRALFSESSILSLKQRTEGLQIMWQRSREHQPAVHKGAPAEASADLGLFEHLLPSSLPLRGALAIITTILFLLFSIVILNAVKPRPSIIQELDSDAAEPRISSTSTRGQIVPAVRSHIRGPVQLFLAEPQLPGATSTGTWEVVVEETVPWVVIWVSSELLHPSGSADADDVDCTPIVTSLPMYGTLYQSAVDGVSPSWEQPIANDGVRVLHRSSRLMLVPSMADRTALPCSTSGCPEEFTLLLPCRGGAEGDSLTMTMRVARPTRGPFDLEPLQLFKPGSEKPLHAGDTPVTLDWLALHNTTILAKGLTHGELHAFVVGEGSLSINQGLRPMLGGMAVEMRGETPRCVRVTAAVAPLQALLASLTYLQPSTKEGSLGGDSVVVTLTLWDERARETTWRSQQVKLPVRLPSGCSPSKSRVSGSGLDKSAAYTLGVVEVRCVEYNGLLREDGGGSRVTVGIEAGELRQTVEAVDAGDGAFRAQFIRPAGPGYHLSVSIDTQQVPGSPFWVAVEKPVVGKAATAAAATPSKSHGSTPQYSSVASSGGAFTDGAQQLGADELQGLGSRKKAVETRLIQPAGGRDEEEEAPGAFGRKDKDTFNAYVAAVGKAHKGKVRTGTLGGAPREDVNSAAVLASRSGVHSSIASEQVIDAYNAIGGGTKLGCQTAPHIRSIQDHLNRSVELRIIANPNTYSTKKFEDSG